MTMMEKTLIIGRHNPLSTHPRDALVPWPVGCSGHRLLEMLRMVRPSITDEQYLDAFARRNLWRGAKWPEGRGALAALRTEGGICLDQCAMFPDVVLLGSKVWDSILDTKPPMYFQWVRIGRTRFWYMPHPSGRNHLFNNDMTRLKAGRVLAGLLPVRMRLEVVK